MPQRSPTRGPASWFGKLGTATASPGEILGRREGKLTTLPEAMDQVRRWRLQGLRIGFTNGCFDLIHPGHAGLLAFARERCDRLVVGEIGRASCRERV